MFLKFITLESELELFAKKKHLRYSVVEYFSF